LILQGTLDGFALPDVLRFLASTAKTGCLHVDGDRGRGQVWLDDGMFAAAATTRLAPETSPLHEMVFELLRFQQGSFSFSPDDPPPGTDGYCADLEAILEQARHLLDEWHMLETVVPSLNHRVTPVAELACRQVTFDAPLWSTFAATAGGCSVAELARSLDVGELDITRRVHDLVELGVAVIEPPTSAPASAAGGRRDTGRQSALPASAPAANRPNRALPLD